LHLCNSVRGTVQDAPKSMDTIGCYEGLAVARVRMELELLVPIA
jgi:hypothetical protein